jgi:molybdate transport system substrate-binding protein
MATKRLLVELVDSYQSTAPDASITVESMGGVDAAKRVADGERYDLAVLASGALDKLTAQGHIVAGSRVDVVTSPVAFAVRAGAPRPAIGSADEVRRAVLAARSVGYSTGPSGDHLIALLKRWELFDALRDRVVQAPPGVPVATLVASGAVELGFQQLSEFMHASGIDVVGLLPDAIQNVTTFAGGITTVSTQPERARALLSFLASPAVAALKRQNGMEPA